jgi:hypothetical protein
MRLFVGLPVPPTVSEALGRLQRAVADRLPDLDIRWQAIDGAHLTLLFLGEVDDDAVSACRRAIEAAAGRHEAQTLTTAPPGAFPGPARPSVLWLGVEESAPLTDLHRDLARQIGAVLPIGGGGPLARARSDPLPQSHHESGGPLHGAGPHSVRRKGERIDRREERSKPRPEACGKGPPQRAPQGRRRSCRGASIGACAG